MSSSGFGSTKALLKAFDRVSIYDWLEKKRHVHVLCNLIQYSVSLKLINIFQVFSIFYFH